MPGHYVISKRTDGWAIAVDGSMLLICERKKMATRVVRDAMRNAPVADAPDPSCEAAPGPEPDSPAERLMAVAG